MKEIVIREDFAGQRFDKFLRRYLPGASGGFLYKMLRKKNIVLNQKKATGKELLAASDVVTIYFSEDTLRKFMAKEEVHYPAPDPAWIIYEDDSVLALNKPAGILSQKSSPEDVSLVEYIRGYLDIADPNIYQPGVSNRLDRNTSGIVLAGKTLSAARSLSEMIRTKSVLKDYLALASGRGLKEQTLSGRLVKDRSANISYVTESAADDPEARLIETHIEPLKEYEALGGLTLLRIRLLTGRSHQIRAQMQAIGHPLAGDVKYGRRDLNTILKKKCALQRQYLHAYRMTFPECSGEMAALSNKMIEAPLPADLPSPELIDAICREAL